MDRNNEKEATVAHNQDMTVQESNLPTPPNPSGYTLPTGKALLLNVVESITENAENDLGRARESRIGHYEGLRGILMCLSLIYIFLRLFAPAAVADRDLDEIYPAAFLEKAPKWHELFRKIASPILFNESLLSSAFILLSTRVSLQTFLERRSPVALSMASTLFRRPFQVAAPVGLAFALTSILVVSGAMRYAPDLSLALSNQSAAPPKIWESTLTYFNSCTGMLMDITTSKIARGPSFLPPGNIGWIVPIIFQLTYTVAVLAYIFPYAVLRWKIIATCAFIIASWWSGRWAWYAATGVLLAEISDLYLTLIPEKVSLPILRTRFKIPIYVKFIPMTMLILGMSSKYLLASFPEYLNKEVVIHVDPTNARLNHDYDVTAGYPRVDNYFILAGLFFLIDITPPLQRLFDNTVLRFLGSLAWSSMLTSGTIMLCLGSALWNHLVVVRGWQNESFITFILFIVCIPSSLLFSIFWRFTVDDGSRYASRQIFNFMIN